MPLDVFIPSSLPCLNPKMKTSVKNLVRLAYQLSRLEKQSHWSGDCGKGRQCNSSKARLIGKLRSKLMDSRHKVTQVCINSDILIAKDSDQFC